MKSELYSLNAYSFDLPEGLIAKEPVHPRDHSRLMRVDRKTGEISHHHFYDLPQLLNPADLLVANNTQVLRARLLGHRILDASTNAGNSRGGQIEFLMLEEKSPLRWEGMFRSGAKQKVGIRFEVPTPDGRGVRGEIVNMGGESAQGTIEVLFDRDPVSSGAGVIPLPPYIDRAAVASDEETYQTVYSKELGSAAAPTAGLHFTEKVLSDLRESGVSWEEVTLHVGMGTFRPVKSEDIREHQMHEERFSISEKTAMAVKLAHAEGRRVVAVGTTSVRTLETAARQEFPLRAGSGRSSLFIYPGAPTGTDKFQVVGAMITNFHLPKSSLLMMISAFAGHDLVMRAYAEAAAKSYRFFSYGDAMLIV